MGTMTALPVNGRVHLITPHGQVVELTSGRAKSLGEELLDVAGRVGLVELELPSRVTVTLRAKQVSRLADELDRAAEQAWEQVADSAAALSGEVQE